MSFIFFQNSIYKNICATCLTLKTLVTWYNYFLQHVGMLVLAEKIYGFHIELQRHEVVTATSTTVNDWHFLLLLNCLTVVSDCADTQVKRQHYNLISSFLKKYIEMYCHTLKLI